MSNKMEPSPEPNAEVIEKSLITHFDYLELESHAPLIALALLIGVMMFQKRKQRLSLIVLSITLFFLCLSIVLSFLHHYYKEEYVKLSQAEISINCIGMAITLGILVKLWYQLGIMTPFKQSTTFLYLILAMVFVIGIMLHFFIKGYIAWYAANIGTDEYDEYYDSLYHLNHIQWHAWIAFFGFIYLMLLSILLKLHESK